MKYLLEAKKDGDKFLSVVNPRPKIYQSVDVVSGLSSQVVLQNVQFESIGLYLFKNEMSHFINF